MNKSQFLDLCVKAKSCNSRNLCFQNWDVAVPISILIIPFSAILFFFFSEIADSILSSKILPFFFFLFEEKNHADTEESGELEQSVEVSASSFSAWFALHFHAFALSQAWPCTASLLVVSSFLFLWYYIFHFLSWDLVVLFEFGRWDKREIARKLWTFFCILAFHGKLLIPISLISIIIFFEKLMVEWYVCVWFFIFWKVNLCFTDSTCWIVI